MKDIYYTEEEIKSIESLGKYSQFLCKKDSYQNIVCDPDMQIANVKVFLKDKLYFAEKKNNKYYIHTPFNIIWCEENWFKENFIEVEEVIDLKIDKVLQ